MNFKYVDIGTSDFDTSLKNIVSGDKILLVEPIFYYLRNLQDGAGIFKANFAISNTEGFGKIYYVKAKDIVEHSLPTWFRGCNSLNSKHPTVVKFLKLLKKPESLISVMEVRKLSFTKLVDVYNVTSIDTLKIDTEGHDVVILSDVYKAILNGLPIREIKFEYIEEFNKVKDPFNCISKIKEQMKLFHAIGYTNQRINGWSYSIIKNSI